MNTATDGFAAAIIGQHKMASSTAIFNKIAEIIAASGPSFVSNTCNKSSSEISKTIELSVTNRDFVEWSKNNANHRTDMDNVGCNPSAGTTAGTPSCDKDDNYYFGGKAGSMGAGIKYEDMEDYNRDWAEEKLMNLGANCFTDLFAKKLWGSIHTAAQKQVKQPIYDPEDLFYYFALALQRLLDPRHKKMGYAINATLSDSFNNPLNRLIYEPFRLMVPDVFEAYESPGSQQGTYPGFYGTGPDEIFIAAETAKDTSGKSSKQNFDVLSTYQFDEQTTIDSWYHMLGEVTTSGFSAALLLDELRSLEAIINLFSCEDLQDLRKDIEKNKQTYEDYESNWIQQNKFSLEHLGAGVWHHDSSNSSPQGGQDIAGAGLAYAWAKAFWDDFLDAAFLITGECEDPETAPEKSDIFPYDPGDCGELDPCGMPIECYTPPNPTCPPLCIPKECDLIDWTTSPNEIVFLNEGTCEYWVPITTAYADAKEKDIDTMMEEYKSSGVQLILSSLGKESSETAVQSFLSQATTDYFVDFRMLAKIKVLVKLPFDVVFDAADKEPELPPDSSDFPLNVVLTAADIRGTGSMFNLVSRAIGRKYAVQVEIEIYKEQFSGLPKGSSLKTQGDNLKLFKKALIDLLRAQDFKFNPARKKSGALEAVEIAFKEEYKGIEYIKANNIGCEAVDLKGGPGWDTFKSQTPCNYATTLAFVANIPSIYDNVTSDSPMAVDLFLKTYYFPPIEENIGEELTMVQEFVDENGCNTTELVANLTKPALIVGSEVLGAALSFPELFAAAIGQKTCLTLEGKEIQDAEYNAFEDIKERWQDVDLRKLFSGDGVFEDLPRKLKEVSNLKELYQEILDKLGVCGLAALVMDALSCILKGLDIDTSMAMLVKSFIKNATEKEMENLFFVFHPSLQQLIRDSVAELTSIPLPWEAGYRPGSYQAAGVKYSPDYLTGEEVTQQERLAKTPDSGGNTPEDNLKRARARAKTTIEEQKEKFKSFADIHLVDENGDQIYDDYGNPVIISSPTGVSPAPGLGPRGYAGPFAHAGSVGTALDNIQDNAIDILKDVIIDAIENNIISGEAMFSFIDKIPGAGLLKDTISGVLDCPAPPLFSPPLDDMLKTLEIDFCEGHYAITLPVIPKISVRPFLGDIKTILQEAFEDALEALIAKSITIIINKILKVLTNAACEGLKDLAGMLKDQMGGSDFRSVVANNLCGDSLNDDELNASLNKLNDSLGSFNRACMPTDEDMGDFMDGISAILIQQELLDFLDGDPSDQAVAYARQIVNGIPNLACALPTDEDIKNLFAGLGRVFDRESLRDKIAASSFKPICPAICASLEDLERFDKLRCSILQEKGLSPQESQEQCQKLKDRALCDFDDLANVLNENYFGDIGLEGNPFCSEDGIYPNEDLETKKLTEEFFDSNYDAISTSFLRELVTKQGLLNMILSDTAGAGFKRHNELWVRLFGQSLSEDLGWFGFTADAFYPDGDAGKSLFVNPTTFGLDRPLNLYPDDVGIYLQKILAFSSDTSPSGIDYELSHGAHVWLKTPYDDMITLHFATYDTEPEDIDDPDWLDIEYTLYPDDDTRTTIKISSQLDGLGAPVEFDVIHDYNTTVPGYPDSSIADKLIAIGAETPTSPNKPYGMLNQAYVFGKLFRSSWAPYTTDQSALQIFEDGWIEMHPLLSSLYIVGFLMKISENSRTFDFGFDPDAEPIKHPLDPAVYGGTDDNPAFWVEEPTYGGWMGLYDKIIPSDDCGHESIVNFNSISSQTAQYNIKLKDDPRLQFPPACVVNSERPFDRAMPRASLAGVDGAIMATARLYVMETLLKGLPAFTMFNPKYPSVYDETLLSYIATKMREGLLDTGLNFRKPVSKERYYYTFLEEVVQNFGKKVDMGEIMPTQVQLEAMTKINMLQELWPPKEFRHTTVNIMDISSFGIRTSAARSMSNKVKRDWYFYYIQAVEPECLVLLNYYIAQQLVEVGKLFNEVLEPPILNLESWIFGSPQWMMLGAITDGGPMPVSSDPLSDTNPTTAKYLGLLANLPEQLPIVLEKYIKVTPYSDSTLFSNTDPQIFSPEVWHKQIGKDNHNLGQGTITDRYYEMSWGLRICWVCPMNGTGPLGSPASFDVDAFDASISDEDVYKTKSLKFGSDPANRIYVVPMASVEIPIDGNEILEPSLTDKYDENLGCLITALINTPEYRTLFKYCFPLETLLSLATIYVVETFLLSIGEEWEEPNGAPRPGGIKGSQFRRWDKAGNFKKTKKNLRRLFEGFYNSRDASYVDQEEETNEQRTRKKLRVKRKLPTDKDIKWWKKRLEVPRPPEECD